MPSSRPVVERSGVSPGELYFRRCLERGPVILAVTDRGARYVWVYNHHPEFDGPALLGKTDMEIDDNPGSRALYQLKLRVLVTGEVLTQEICFPLAGGSMTYEVTASPLREAGALVGVSTVGLDITARRAASEARAEVREEQLRLVSHDLRAPLNVIGLVASRLAAVSEAATVALAERIQSNVRWMSRLLEDILDIGESEQGGPTLRCEITALAPFLAEVLEAGLTPAQRDRVKLEATCACSVWFDHAKIGRVVLNLVDNALKFSPPRSPVVIGVSSEAEWVRVSVRDEGPGLDRASAEAAFQKYWTSPGSSASGGKGLGLYAARLLVAAHGGRCQVDSSPGQGATFWFELPCGPG